MHEMSIAEGIRSAIEAAGRAQDFTRVAHVRLEIGALAGVERAALEFAFDVAMRGSIAEGASLTILDLPARARCPDCAQVVEIAHRLEPCPACGGTRLRIESGTEMRIKDLEVY